MLSKRKGFTLTEVLVVVLIIGILGAIAYPVYTKTIMRSRAAEAINLLELTRDKQMTSVARQGQYFNDFGDIDQLTANKSKETPSGRQMNVGKYTISLNEASECLTVTYPNTKPQPAFSFSSSYDDSTLGCTGAICQTFAGIVGNADSICNCGGQTCGAGFDQNNLTCECKCSKLCNQGGTCFDPYTGGGATTKTERTANGRCTYTCKAFTADCNGGTCTDWGTPTCICTNNAPLPTVSCSNGQTITTSYQCVSGVWKPVEGTPTRVDCCDNERKTINEVRASDCYIKTGTAICRNNKWVDQNVQYRPGETKPALTSTCSAGTLTTITDVQCDTQTGRWIKTTSTKQVDCCAGDTKPSTTQTNPTTCARETINYACVGNKWVTSSSTSNPIIPEPTKDCSVPGRITTTTYACVNGGVRSNTSTVAVREPSISVQACGPCNKGMKSSSNSWNKETCSYDKIDAQWGECIVPAGVCDPAKDRNCDANCEPVVTKECTGAKPTNPAEGSLAGRCVNNSRGNNCTGDYLLQYKCDETTGTWVQSKWCNAPAICGGDACPGKYTCDGKPQYYDTFDACNRACSSPTKCFCSDFQNIVEKL